jgi:hypothetical protein
MLLVPDQTAYHQAFTLGVTARGGRDSSTRYALDRREVAPRFTFLPGAIPNPRSSGLACTGR